MSRPTWATQRDPISKRKQNVKTRGSSGQRQAKLHKDTLSQKSKGWDVAPQWFNPALLINKQANNQRNDNTEEEFQHNIQKTAFLRKEN